MFVALLGRLGKEHIRFSSYSSSAESSMTSTSCRTISAVASPPRALLSLVDDRSRFRDVSSLLSCEGSCSSFRFGECLDVWGPVLAKDKTVGRALTYASTASSRAPFHRNFDSCSGARHAGHLPSFASDLRIHKEQNVCRQVVSMGVL